MEYASLDFSGQDSSSLSKEDSYAAGIHSEAVNVTVVDIRMGGRWSFGGSSTSERMALGASARKSRGAILTSLPDAAWRRHRVSHLKMGDDYTTFANTITENIKGKSGDNIPSTLSWMDMSEARAGAPGFRRLATPTCEGIYRA